MEEEDQRIGPLKKISLLIEAEGDGEEKGRAWEPGPFEFIFGIGSEGLSPFEMALTEKSKGDELVLDLAKEETGAYFQHLFPPLNLTTSGDALSIRVQVVDVVPASQREIIKAMAEAASCADHCCGQ